MSARYPTPTSRRMALAPGILGAIVLFVGLALLDSEGYIVIRYAVSILAIIVTIYAVQAKHWWWLVALVPMAVIWNPVFPITIDDGRLWAALQYVAAGVFIVAGALIRVPVKDDGPQRVR